MGPINPLFAYAAAGALVIGVGAGWKVRDWQCDAAYSKALEKAERERKALQGKINAISTTYEQERDQTDMVVAGTRTTIREIYKTLPAVPADCSPDVRVIGLLQGSVSDANRAASGKSSE
jgi:hypothetical protein